MVELVWDAERLGTATAPSGATATVGENASFAPDDLMAMAAAGCLMRTFLQLADVAHVEILSYAATAHFDPPCDAASARLQVRTYVTAPPDVTEGQLRGLLSTAEQTSPVARVLGDRLTCHSHVRRLRDACPR